MHQDSMRERTWLACWLTTVPGSVLLSLAIQPACGRTDLEIKCGSPDAFVCGEESRVEAWGDKGALYQEFRERVDVVMRMHG